MYKQPQRLPWSRFDTRVSLANLLSDIQVAKAQNVTVTDDSLTVDLIDGHTISVPL